MAYRLDSSPLPGDGAAPLGAVPSQELDEVLESFLGRLLDLDDVKHVEVSLFDRHGDAVPVASGSEAGGAESADRDVRVDTWVLGSHARHTRRRASLPDVTTALVLPLVDSGDQLGFLKVQLNRIALLGRNSLGAYQAVADELATRLKILFLHGAIDSLKEEYRNLVLENRELVHRLASVSKELYAISAISTKINQSMDFEVSLRRSLRKVRDVFGAAAVAVFVDSEDFGALEVAEPEGPADGEAAADYIRSRFVEVLALEKPAVLRAPPAGGTGGAGEVIVGVPLRTRDTSVGALVLVNSDGDAPGPDGLRLLAGVASVMTMAIENMNLYRQTERGKRDAAFLGRSIAHFNRTLELRQVLESVVVQASEFTGRGGRVCLFSETRFPIVSAACREGGGGWEYRFLGSVEPRGLRAVLRWVVTRPDPVLILDSEASAGGGEDPVPSAVLRQLGELSLDSLIGVPLVGRGGRIGLLLLGRGENQDPFDAHDLSIAEALGNAASGAIENARAYAASLDRADSSEFKISEKEDQIFRIHEEHHRRIEGHNDVVFWLDRQDHVVLGNRALESLTDRSKEELSSGALEAADMVFAEDWGRLAEAFDRIRSGELGLADGLECRLRGGHGQEHYIMVSAHPLKDLSGQIIGIEGIGRDITEEKRLEAELAKAKDLALLGEFSSAVAHQIRNPLGNILMGAKLLQRGMVLPPAVGEETPPPALGSREPDGAALTQVFHDLCEGIGNLDHVVSELLTYTRTMKLRPSSQDLNELLVESVREFNGVLAKGTIRVETCLDEALPRAEVDAVLLGSVFRNLVHNAIQAMPEGGRLLLWSGRSARREGHAVLSVSDSGVGIPRGDLARIFRPFFTTKDVGVGLGLSLAHRIVDAHRGGIWACNNPCRDWGEVWRNGGGQGSPPACGATIHVLLPLGPDPVETGREGL